MVVERPRDVESCPYRRDLPLGPEEARPVKGLIFSKQVFIADPKGAVIPEFVVQLLQPLACPLLYRLVLVVIPRRNKSCGTYWIRQTMALSTHACPKDS